MSAMRYPFFGPFSNRLPSRFNLLRGGPSLPRRRSQGLRLIRWRRVRSFPGDASSVAPNKRGKLENIAAIKTFFTACPNHPFVSGRRRR
jgi:hypothetical protein